MSIQRTRQKRAIYLFTTCIGYLAAALEQEDYKVDVVDCQTTKHINQTPEDKFRILNPYIIGVTSATVTYLPTLDVLKQVKAAATKARTVMSGNQVTVLDKEALKCSNNIDVVV